jgi:hypothetical protein
MEKTENSVSGTRIILIMPMARPCEAFENAALATFEVINKQINPSGIR